MANFMLCIFLLALVNLSISLSDSQTKILTAIDSNGQTHSGIGTVSPGQSITIQCPHTNSKWSRSSFNKGSSIENLVSNNAIEIKDNQLKIFNITFKDSGLYYCEEYAVALRFYLHVLAITKTKNGTATLSREDEYFDNKLFVRTTMSDKYNVNVSCFCENGSNNTQLNIDWKGGLYGNKSDLYTIITLKNDIGINSTLILKKPTNDKELFGEYTCSCNAVSNTVKEAKVYMHMPPNFGKYETSIRLNEGEDVVFNCNALSYPALTSMIEWRFQNNSVLRNGSKVTVNSSMPGFSQLSLSKVTNADRGIYSCHASNGVSSNYATITLRVKSYYAALWPFLGILIQLVILIAIIAVYEWKKSQKSKEDKSKCNFDSRNEPDALVTDRGNEPESVRQRLVKV